jgi:hypothetical protein
MTAAHKWASQVANADDFLCAAQKHAVGCSGRHEETHHIVYRSHLTKDALWLVANGIALSVYCHRLAHATHNQNIAPGRLRSAVDAVNAVHPARLRRPHFEKALA